MIITILKVITVLGLIGVVAGLARLINIALGKGSIYLGSLIHESFRKNNNRWEPYEWLGVTQLVVFQALGLSFSARIAGAYFKLRWLYAIGSWSLLFTFLLVVINILVLFAFAAYYGKFDLIGDNEVSNKSKEDSEWEWVFTNYQKSPTTAFIKAFLIGCEDGAVNFIEEIKESAKKHKVNPDFLFTRIYFEYLYFFLHLLDRNMFAELGAKKRTKFMKDFTLKAFNSVIESFDSRDKKQLFSVLCDGYNDAIEQYLPYQNMLPPRDKPFSEDALCPQLGKRIARVLQLDMNDVANKMKMTFSTYTPIASFQVVVDLREWAKGPVMELGLKSYKTIELVDKDKQNRITKMHEQLDKPVD